MGTYQGLLLLVAFVGLVSSETKSSWDIPFQLNRKYGLTAMSSDLVFPMEIEPPSNGELYSTPAQTFFDDKQFPDTTLYMQLNFQPNLTLDEFYIFTIRDPDGILRFSLSMYKTTTYRIQMRYNPLDSTEGEQMIEFPYAQSQSYWRLGIWIRENSVDFYTNCPSMQPAPFHEAKDIKLLGRPLFREGASAFMLNSGVKSNPLYFQGILTEFTFHTGQDAIKAPCKSIELKEESGESIWTFSTPFGNVFDNDTTTITTQKFTTIEEPTTTLNPLGDDEDQSTIQFTSDNGAPTLSTIISFTSDTIDQSKHEYLIPIVDLLDMSVKILNTEENRIVEEAWISNGYIQFENGTSLPIRDVQGISPPETTVNNVRISVSLDDGKTSLVNLETGTVIMSRKSSEGIPPEVIRKYNEGALLEILSGNMAIQVDTFNGQFTVQNVTSAEVQLVQEVVDSIIYLANGDEIRLPTTGNDNEAIAIDALTGKVRTINKEAGEAEIILTTTVGPEIITGDTTHETREESITLTTVEATPENEITTEIKVTKSPDVSDTTEVVTGESSFSLTSEESSTETRSFEMSATAHPGTESLTESNDGQADPSKENSTSIATEFIQTTVTSQAQGESITETTEVTPVNSNDKTDTTEHVTSNEDNNISLTGIPTTMPDFTAGVSESESDTSESVGYETMSVTSSDQDFTATEPDTTPDDSSNSQTTVNLAEVTSDPQTEQPGSEVSTDTEKATESVDSEPAGYPEAPNTPSTVEHQPTQEILKPDCSCLEKLLTPKFVEKLRENKTANLDTNDKIYDELFRTPSFLQVVREVIDEYFERPGIAELYKPKCNCPVNNGCSCTTPETPPSYNVSSPSKHILGALKDMSNGAIIMSNKTALTKIASSLAPGSMVYLNTENMFYLKVDERENIWQTIDMNTQSEAVHIPEPEETTTTTVKPSLPENLVGMSLILVGHNEPLNGQLRFGAKLSGGHSSAIFACQRAAKRYNVSHIFYPLMNTDIFSMDYVVPPMYRYDMSIVNIKGEVIFDDFMRMINGQQAPMAPIYTFDGKELNSDPTVPCAWIGAKPLYLNGDYEFAARAKCRNWQSREPTETGLAVYIPMNNNATAFFDQSNLYNESCAKRCSVLCIQISPN